MMNRFVSFASEGGQMDKELQEIIVEELKNLDKELDGVEDKSTSIYETMSSFVADLHRSATEKGFI